MEQLYSGLNEQLWNELESHRIAELADRIAVERDGWS